MSAWEYIEAFGMAYAVLVTLCEYVMCGLDGGTSPGFWALTTAFSVITSYTIVIFGDTTQFLAGMVGLTVSFMVALVYYIIPAFVKREKQK